MGVETAISWCHHTFNIWWGCLKVSEACAHCYAETWAKRTGFTALWTGERRLFGDKHWNEPVRWNAAAAKAGERRRCFSSSMADNFERHANPETDAAMDANRARLWTLIEVTPWLDWLLLTKRPENIRAMVPAAWLSGFPTNVIVGCTAENQRRVYQREPYLLNVPARRFLSMEPLSGPVKLSPALLAGLCWVITGGESGGKARPSHPDWFRAIRDQCAEAGVPFHHKQWGEYAEVNPEARGADGQAVLIPTGEAIGKWTALSTAISVTGHVAESLDAMRPDVRYRHMRRIGKVAAGHLLDGVEHLAFPAPL